jgi:hypothetical protein
MNEPYELAVVFTGHMTDLPGRNSPRFPEKMARSVSDEIGWKLLELYNEHESMFLISSAARGADIIAIEHAHQLGVKNHIVIPFSAEDFVETSVIGTHMGGWKRRFNKVLNSTGLEGYDYIDALYGDSEKPESYEVCNIKMWELAKTISRKQVLLSFWNEADKKDFAIGGTGSFVDYVTKNGGEHININANTVLERFLSWQKAEIIF